MKHFEEILSTLGASNVKSLEDTGEWNFWKAEFSTPVGVSEGYYLYLKHKCPLKESSPRNQQKWRELSGQKDYEVIVTPSSELSKDLEKTRKTFRGKSIQTTQQILLNNFLKNMNQRPFSNTNEYFIDPSIELENEKSQNDATKFLSQWITGRSSTEKNSSLSVLTANGGVGKTTLSRELCKKIFESKTNVIPILIESDQWKEFSQARFTLDHLWDLALSKRFENSSRILANKTALKVLINEGIFVVIFDGFDELCLNQSLNIRAKELINDLHQMLESEEEGNNAKILLTTRETYWETISDEIDSSKIEIFKLKGFDNDQRKKYFSNRLKTENEVSIAQRIAKQISGGVYEGVKKSDKNEERFSGVPFILDLIAEFVSNNIEENINPYDVDPFKSFLEDVCRRESRRQSLDLTPAQQFEVFEELFRAFKNGFTKGDIEYHLQILCGVNSMEVVNGFTNHVFLKRITADKFEPKYEVLRVYFVARFLAYNLANVVNRGHRAEISETLADNYTGKTQLIEWLVLQLKQFEGNVIESAIRHAIEILNHVENKENKSKASQAIFHIITELIPDNDKKEKTENLLKYYGHAKKTEVKNAVFSGSVKSYDFRSLTFNFCDFINVEFKNCNFDESTKFINCKFNGVIDFINCHDAGKISLSEDCSFSKESEIALNKIRQLSSRDDLIRHFAEDALLRALKRFKGDFGFSDIQYRNRNSGFKKGNPCNEKIWDVLIKNEIIEKHPISNVDEGGIHISKDKVIRKEIMSYLDNGVIGKNLKRVVSDLLSN